MGIGLVLALAILAWPLLTSNPLGNPTSGANPSAADTTSCRGVPAQQAGQNAEAKSNPGGAEDASGGRVREIKQMNEPLSLNDEQIKDVRQTLKSTDNPPKIGKADFEMMVGTAVPKHTTRRTFQQRFGGPKGVFRRLVDTRSR
jgi:hypothetical protein